MKYDENVLECAEMLGRSDFCDFCGFRADRTPPEPMNSLCISMVWGAFGRPGARRNAFWIFM